MIYNEKKRVIFIIFSVFILGGCSISKPKASLIAQSNIQIRIMM